MDNSLHYLPACTFSCGAEGEERHMRSYAQSKITELAIFVDLALPSSVSNVSQTSLLLPGSGMS
jgi:hypothetical protein